MKSSEKFQDNQNLVWAATLSAIVVLIATKSIAITVAITIVAIALASFSRIQKENRFTLEIRAAIPEIIESVLSAIQSGLSLTEALISLGRRGPEVTRNYFHNFEANIRNGVSFEDSISVIQDQFSNRLSDQLFEAIIFANSLGGSELHSLLRQIGLFTRADSALRDEIKSKQSWVRNSAHVAAAAPWILLVMLSLQPASADAFSTTAGLLLLTVGVALTLIAYLWMNQIAKMPEQIRVFGSKS